MTSALTLSSFHIYIEIFHYHIAMNNPFADAFKFTELKVRITNSGQSDNSYKDVPEVGAGAWDE